MCFEDYWLMFVYEKNTLKYFENPFFKYFEVDITTVYIYIVVISTSKYLTVIIS